MDQYDENEIASAIPDSDNANAIDESEQLPVYYSERAIYVCSTLFGVFFGSVLLAMNIDRTTEKKGVAQVILFGIFFTIIQVWGSNMLSKGHDFSLTILSSMLGAIVLRRFFWEQYIGKDISYINRSILVPSIIGIAMCTIFLLARFA
jgi:hypothetical protein